MLAALALLALELVLANTRYRRGTADHGLRSQSHISPNPHWLWLAVLGPLLLVALHRYCDVRRGSEQLARFAAPHFLEELTRSHSPAAARVQERPARAGRCAASGSRWRGRNGANRKSRGQSLGEDIVFVLDCSRSMLATDVRPNRLQRAKLAILDFVQRHGRGRVGLVAFAGQAFLQCPLTFDYERVRGCADGVG